MRHFSKTISIAASPAQVWRVLADVERWPEWTQSVKSVQRLDTASMTVGSQVRIEQPKLRPAIWTVTVWVPEKSFTWVSKSGVTVTGAHEILPTSNGCDVVLTIHFGGLLGSVVGYFAGQLTTEYMAMEANGLKQRAESPD